MSVICVLLTCGLGYCWYFLKSFPSAVMYVHEGCPPGSLGTTFPGNFKVLGSNPS